MSKVVIDIADLTVGEAEEFEAESGVSLTDLEKGVPVKAIAYLVWVIQKRNNPKYTLDDARKLKMSDLEWSDGNPTEGDS